MSNTRVMVCHPGHTHSTSDVFDGLCAGLALNDVEVVPFQWDRPLQVLGALVIGAQAGGMVKPHKAEDAMRFISWLAAADAISLAIDQHVDAAIVVNGLLFPPDRARVLSQLGIPVACYGTEAPYFLKEEQAIAPFYTHWFTNERTCVKDFGPHATYLPHAYNPALHQPGAVDPAKAVDAVFIGGGYPERRALLDGQGVTTRGTLWHLDLDAEIGKSDHGRGARYAEGAIPNEETSAWHRSAKVALNLHRRMTYLETGGAVAAGSESLGPRAYEIPAVGGFQLIDNERAEVHEVFGDSAATFRAWDRADLAHQLRYWLTHDDARERQQRAQADAIRPHHWGTRANTVLETIL